MKQIKMDILRTVRENLLDLMIEGELFLHEFEVYPFDYNILDYATPKIYMTNRQLFFTYDEVIEVYDLNTLKFDIYGEDPKFSVWQQWMEGKFYYSYGQEDNLVSLKNADYYTHLVITEPQQIPKEFAYRKGPEIGKSYQSWAMAQQMMNSKNNLPEDPRLEEMLTNNFNKFNGRTIVVYAVVFAVYVVLTRIVGFLPDIIGTVLDVIFAIITGFVGVWLYRTVNKNYDAFGAIYNSYKTTKSTPNNSTTVIPPTTPAVSNTQPVNPQPESAQAQPVQSNVQSSPIPVVKTLESERNMTSN